MSDLLSLLDTIESQPLDTSAIAGGNLRLTPGRDTEFAIEENLSGLYHSGPLTLTRFTVRQAPTQEHPVVVATILTSGERVSIVRDGKAQLLRQYTDPNAADWRSGVHIINTEFQNPNGDSVDAICEMLLSLNWPQYTPPAVATTRPARENTSEVLFDRVAPGDIMTRFMTTGVALDSVTLLPAYRHGVMQTHYVSREGADVTKTAFTNFVDAGLTNWSHVAKLITAQADPVAIRQARNNMNLLCGMDENGFVLRPTLGYFTPVGGDSISLFPNRDNENATAAAPAAGKAAPSDADNEDEEPF